MADFCGLKEMDLTGMGIEEIIHPHSLPEVISNIKYRSLGEPGLPVTNTIYFNGENHTRLEAKINVYALNEPEGAFLVMVANA